MFTSIFAAEKYVSVGGSGNICSISSPCALQTALDHPAAISPGDIVYLRGGTYYGAFISRLTGTPGNPITVRSYPGEWAVIDSNQNVTLSSPIAASGGGTFTVNAPLNVPDSLDVMIDNEFFRIHKINSTTFSVYFRAGNGSTATAHSVGAPVYLNTTVLTINGADTIFRDLEVTNTSTIVDPRPTGIMVYAPRSKVINTIIYNTGMGIGTWNQATDSELYGNIIYNNGGRTLAGVNYGVGIYAQNVTGTKKIQDNIVFGSWNVTEQKLFSSNAEGSYNTEYRRNITTVGRFIIGGHARSDNITLDQNYFYQTTPELGYSYTPNGRATLTGNYIVGKTHALNAKYWENITATNNKFYYFPVGGAHHLAASTNADTPISGYNFNNNEYRSNDRAWIDNNETYYDFTQWRALGKDTNSTFRSNFKTDILYNRNFYEVGRCHVVVYNWSNNPSVSIDLSQTGLASGQSYKVRNGLDWHAGPIASGIYTDDNPTVSLSSLQSMAQPIPASGRTNPTVAPTFLVFVIEPLASTNTPSPPILRTVSSNPTLVLSKTSLVVSWDPPEFGTVPTGYKLRWTTSNNVYELKTTQTTQTIFGLKPGIPHTFEVFAVNSFGISSASNSITKTPGSRK